MIVEHYRTAGEGVFPQMNIFHSDADNLSDHSMNPERPSSFWKLLFLIRDSLAM